MDIYSKNFKPTRLYIKQHSITKKLYFGRTSKKDPYKYLGSGSYWTKHIKKHGIEHVKTLWCQLFFDEKSINEFAINFSQENNIVESDNWANIIVEDGLSSGDHSNMILVKYPGTEKLFKVHKTDNQWINGAVVAANKNRPLKDSTKQKLSDASRKFWNTPEAKAFASKNSTGINNSMYGKVKEQNWRYKNFSTNDIKNHLTNGLSIYKIAEMYHCTTKCIRCRILSETGIHFKKWRDSLIASGEISSSQFYRNPD